MDLRNLTCGECDLFRPVPLQKVGMCKRYPPQLLISQQGLSSTAIPVKTSEEACGEFKPLTVIEIKQ